MAVENYLEIVRKEKAAHIIYEDEKALAFIPEEASAPGEILVIPKLPYQIIEQIPPEELAHLSVLVKKLSDICFELLSGQGTNILVSNGPAAGQEVAHVAFRILPRREGDSIDMSWTTKREDEKELDSALNILGSATKHIYISAMESKHKDIPEKKEKKEEILEKPKDGEIDYRLDFLKGKYE
jgi:histidine triad (HIT) family protein